MTTGREVNEDRPSIDYDVGLMKDLQDADFAAEYINAAIEEDDKETFLLALHDVVRARGGFAEVAEKTNKSRSNMYAMLSKTGNPTLSSLNGILDSVGLSLQVTSKSRLSC